MLAHVRKKVDAPGRLFARSVGADERLFARGCSDWMRPDERETIRKEC